MIAEVLTSAVVLCLFKYTLESLVGSFCTFQVFTQLVTLRKKGCCAGYRCLF